MPIYAIYTSGSTGQPKAAIIPHRGITNRFLWMNEYFGQDPVPIVLQTTSHVYDSAIWQLFWPLINGGTTIIPFEEKIFDPAYIANLIANHAVNLIDFVPSVFNTIAPGFSGKESCRKLTTLQTVILGGEELHAETVHQLKSLLPNVRLTNLYGPTEASIGCIFYDLHGNEQGKIPIGKPIANVSVLILDQHGQPVPVGVVGELYLSGVCLGLGYLNDKQKTRESFVDNLFSEIFCNNLYRTGDLARYLPDGNIEFIGRIDRQVKIRGFRIELGEIETALSSHDTIKECVITTSNTEQGDKKLVAYIVSDESISSLSLRRLLRDRLPDYMIPSLFVPLDTIPLTSSGKIDYKLLHSLSNDQIKQETDYIAPTSFVEKTIAKLWHELLGVSKIGLNDNFFDLGGHSLLVIRAISLIESRLKICMTFGDFMHQSLGQIAVYCEEKIHKNKTDCMVEDA